MSWFNWYKSKPKLVPVVEKIKSVSITIWFNDGSCREFIRPRERESNIWHFMNFYKWYHCRDLSETYSFAYNTGVLSFRKSDITRFEIKGIEIDS